MSSWFSPWSNHIKKIACRYLLHRYLGKFIQEKLGFEQLDIDIYNGKVSVSDVSLDCEALNEVGDSQGWPFEIVDGHVAEITVTIPWSTPLTEDSVVEVRGLSLTVQPKVMTDPASSMIEDMCMTTSMMLAEECIKENEPESRTIEGIEALSSAIDSIIRRIKVRFIDTKIRMEHVPKQSERGIAVDVHIDNMAYSGDESVAAQPEESDSESDATRTDSPTYKKIFKCTGISVYSDEFHSKLRTMSRSLYSSMDKSASTEMAGSETEHNINVQFQSTTSDIFYDSNFKSTISEPSGSVYEEPSTPEPEEDILPTTRILIAKLEGEHQMVVTMQPTYDEHEWPKIEIDFEFDSLKSFLSPRQLHIVMDLIDAFQKPQTEDTSNIPIRPRNHRPMTAADYQIIENQLLADKLEARNRIMDCWSGPGADEEDDVKFYPMTSHAPDAMSDSCTSDGNSISTSMTSGLTFMSADQYNQASRRSRRSLRTEGDPTAEISRVNIQINSVICVILHKQVILPTKPHGNDLDRSTIATMQALSRNFFERMPSGRTDFALVMAATENSVDRNHLRIALRELSLNGNEKSTQRMCVRACEVTVGGALVQEGLYEPSRAPLTRDILKFDLNNSSESSLATQHCIKVNYKQTARYTRLGGQKRLDPPDVEITVKCAPCHLELDLTLLERMSASVYGGSERAPAAAAEPDAHASPPPPARRRNFALYCTNMRVALRFPIADLRERAPHQCDARNIRPDFLMFNFKNVTISSNRTAKQPLTQPTAIALKCTQLSLDYHETEISAPINIAEATYDDSSNETRLPTITLKLGASESSTSPYEQFYNSKVTDSMTTSVYMMTKLRKSEPSPFSGIKSAHQSMIKKIRSDKDRDQNNDDEDENRHEKQESQHEHDLIIPGNAEEMLEFTTSSSDLSKIHLDFDLPILSIQMESKHLYEVIYNRINSDLLLWEPYIVDDYELIDDSEPQTFTRCRSQSQEDAWEQEESESVGYDAFSGEELPPEESNNTLHHKFCLTFKAHKGLLTIYTPVRDNNKKVVPGQVGELVLELNAVSLCHVSGVRAAPRSALFGLRARRATLYHNSMLAVSEKRSRVRLYGTTLPSGLKKIIYPSSQKVFLADKDLNMDNFVLALKMSPDAAETNRKHMCLSLALQQCTARHRGAEGAAWLHHFLDVIDVEDYPVLGYTPSAVVTEMHFNIVDCALDYRPLYLPLRTLLTAGDVYICNNIVQSSRASCFKLIAQECSLFLAYVFEAGASPDDGASPDVRSREYVCVADTDLLELNARVDQKKKADERPLEPLVEIGACNSKVTVHTCWDSGTALGQLIAYVSAGGDARAPDDPPSRHTSVSSDHDETLIGLDNKYGEQSEPSRNEIEQMYQLMEEALKESPPNTNKNGQARSTSKETDEDVYLFPDELNQQQMDALSEAIDDSDADSPTRGRKGQPMDPQVAADLGIPSTARTRREAPRRRATDDGYCLVEPIKEEKLSDDLNPTCKSQRPHSLGVSDKFAKKPNVKADVLRAPASYPVPVNRFTLFEMNVEWHVYGGRDFRRPPPADKPQKTVTIKDRVGAERSPLGAAVRWRAGSECVTHARVPRPLPPPGPARLLRLTARQRAALLASGGRLRDPAQCVIHCLHKLKYVQEKYPSWGRHAARQVLAVGRIEVLDRMRCSAINKLLTCFRVDHEPARDNAHMLVVKASHMRMSPTLPIQECSTKVSMMPLRFHFDQDTITFLGNFFYKLGDDINAPEDGEQAAVGAGASGGGGGSKQPSPTHRPPVISVGDSLRDPLPDPHTLTDAQALQLENLHPAEPALLELLTARRLLSENLIQLEEDYKLNEERDAPADEGPADAEVVDEMPVFFRRAVFKPEVPIQLDYVAKRVDMNSGPFIGLLMGLANLKCSELKLKAFDNRQGILGTQKLLKWMVQQWLDDIKKNQLGGLMQGVGPMHTIRELLLGFRDLLVMPLEQWQRDGRLMLGLRRGAASFSARTAVAALDITTQLLRIIQATAEMVMQNPSLPPPPESQAEGEAGNAHPRRPRRKPKRRSRPKDLRDGMQTAYQTVKEGIAETAAMVARCEGGMGVLRTLPGAAVAPLKVAAEGAADVLGGVRAHLAPHARRDDADKWRDHGDDAPQH